MKRSLRKIVVVFKTHFDIGFTGLVEEVLESYAHGMIPAAIDACRETAGGAPGHRFAWTLPAWPLAECLRRTDKELLGAELRELVRQGRITWHALPFTTHTELFGLEDLIRGLYVGRDLAERFGRRAIAAKMTDVPGHTWILPTVLASAGVRFLHLGCNACSTPPDVPFLFRWEGPDGSSVITMYSRGGYGTPLFPPADWNLPVWLALQHTVDNVGPQQAAAVERILKDAREKYPGAEVVVGSLDDFAQALDAVKPDLPVVRKDLADSWIHGVGTMPGPVGRIRGVRNRLIAVESAAALLGRDVAAAASAAYEKILLFGEHTWGMDTKLALNPSQFGGREYSKPAFQRILASGAYERIQRSWSDKAKLVDETEAAVKKVEAMTAGEPGDAALSLPSRRLLTNHHLWPWTGLIRLGSFAGSVTATRESDNSELPVLSIDGSSWVRVEGLPPLSSTAVRLEARKQAKRDAHHARTKGSVLDNGLVRIEVDPDAGVTGLIDRASGRNWVDRKPGMPFGAFRYDVFSRRDIVQYLKAYAYDLESWFLDDFGRPGYPAGEHRTFFGSLDSVDADEGSGWKRLRLLWKQDRSSVVELGNAERVIQGITLFDELPFVEMDFRLEGKEPSPMLDAGHVVFPVRAVRPRYAISKTGSVIDPAADIAVDANRVVSCCERWVDVTDDGSGLLVIPYHTPLVSIGAPGIERFDGRALPGAPVLYFNLFNTQWGTNFPQWIGGSFTFSYRLVPHTGDWRKAKAWEHAAAALQPPSCLPAPAAQLDSRLSEGLLPVPVRGLQTVCIKRAEAGDGVILRLQEPTGRGGSRTLNLRASADAKAPTILRCSLLEDEQERIKAARTGSGYSVSLTVRPFEIVTLKLRP